VNIKTIYTAIIWILLFSDNSAAADGIGCPKGTEPKGEQTPEVSEAWCEKSVNGKVLMHGHTVRGGLMENSGLKANMKMESRSDYGVAGTRVVNFKARNYLKMAAK
jgi:hypothetical protein